MYESLCFLRVGVEGGHIYSQKSHKVPAQASLRGPYRVV